MPSNDSLADGYAGLAEVHLELALRLVHQDPGRLLDLGGIVQVVALVALVAEEAGPRPVDLLRFECAAGFGQHRHRAEAGIGATRRGLRLTVDETVILLHPPLPLVGISIVTERGCQQNDSLVRGYLRRAERARDQHDVA